jgi:hypothetical protein
MSKRISIGWFRQKSGRYALKGITINEDNHAYDAMGTFREEDAKWLTRALDAHPDVEISGGRMGERTAGEYPEWANANNNQPQLHGDGTPPLDWERASATLLRHYLAQMIQLCDTDDGNVASRKLTAEASALLMATDAGTYYNLEEARAIVGRRAKKPGAGKIKA